MEHSSTRFSFFDAAHEVQAFGRCRSLPHQYSCAQRRGAFTRFGPCHCCRRQGTEQTLTCHAAYDLHSRTRQPRVRVCCHLEMSC
eukprot:scaffold28840_cov49-Prasinocladus_malaysianus.AAC.5